MPPTPAPTLTPTADTRLLPSQWKQWPIVPVVTGRGLEIYRQGIAMGNDPHAFSKVADCQGIKEVLLGAYDLNYTLTPEHASLQEAIDWFAGSFNRNGEATMGGFNARAVLQPQFADPAYCLPGETPLACEVRVHHPSIAIVSEEFGYDGRTTANYVQYIRAILDFLISKGVLPILATKADNFEGDNSLNLATATLAYEYDLPLWNWWLAAQPLPDHGLDITRPDGFHISVDAWRVRASTALQALDSVWRGVRDAAPLSDSAASVTATPGTVGQETHPTPALDPGMAAAYSSGHALFGLAQRKGEGYEYLGVYAFDPDPKAANPLQQILGTGWNLQGVTSDSKNILVNRGSELWYLPLDGSAPQLLTQSLAQGRGKTATWFPGGEGVIFAGDATLKNAIYLVRPGSQTAPGQISQEGAQAIELLYTVGVMGAGNYSIYFLSGQCSAPGICGAGKVMMTMGDINYSVDQGEIRQTLASNGNSLAYSFFNEKDRTVLAVTTLDRAKIWSPLPDGYALDYTWSPSGRWLAALLLERSDYSGRAGPLDGFLLNPLTLDKVALPAMSGLSARLAWSADGAHLLVVATGPLNLRNTDFDKGYRLNLYSINPATGQSTGLDGKISPSSQEYLFATNIAWIP